MIAAAGDDRSSAASPVDAGLGTGLPTANNTHEVAQGVAPDSKVVYVDNDPTVLAHADALLRSTPEGKCAYLDADVRDPQKILSQAAHTLDFDRPIGLMLLNIIGQISDEEEPGRIVAELVDALPRGSYVALSDGTATSEELKAAVEAYNAQSTDRRREHRPQAACPPVHGRQPQPRRAAEGRPVQPPLPGPAGRRHRSPHHGHLKTRCRAATSGPMVTGIPWSRAGKYGRFRVFATPDRSAAVAVIGRPLPVTIRVVDRGEKRRDSQGIEAVLQLLVPRSFALKLL